MKKITGLIVIIGIMFLLMAFYFANFSEESTVVKYWEQPKSVDSGKFKYRLSILEIKSKLQFFKIGEQQNQYKIVISKNNTKPELHFMLGHIKLYSFSESNKHNSNWKELDIVSYIKKVRVNWSNKGVVFIEPSGHELFFPAKVYISEKIK